ncbi:NADH dehydrogenase subunit C [Novosphingobium aromaticivorans DSM 12444]|uniref:NADH-quinone oxidoreductase subunit C n=1 Tax=Novosphingobium aromaticivorans (strain ATCC 700278 / DSM 12444 / CCUG 56034 / CIP 105152 / NBRC 16084 / F199) TaxID=279238 RepID=NUOC_NOVAD|nr:NADH-quinone oxidoreductase subunit C [Novosphingobium aromaticivorans]Q2G5Y5.1 RecName: Full=NADH-quinone oxidoreductase subunit C; AltName: Full=NADH dehydrogenase I subunit C; AltName: Full=NDH-1 subunit C [Novosphingobium aromaticivorans DSM 12444]ABD26738.1 NADH dehydrogenase subunit C [Novosphingobium aromaticivorans DSM 12444]SCY40729.1 NADH dehydrogenase subunit C [Novosphingobium aromaticivorans]
MTVLHSAPRWSSNEGVLDTLVAALGDMVAASREEHGEILLTVVRDRVEDALRLLRDDHEYQQLMDIAGVDYPQRAERFDVCYCLLSVTKNHRVIVKVSTDEATPVPTVTTLWPNAGWYEREVYDMFGVLFAGNPDLRRILTDYGFQGHPFRKDFPLTGYVELRYSEEDKRVVYEPVQLAQDLRQFDFMSPWEGADYVLPGDEKAVPPPPAPAPVATAPETKGDAKADVPKTTEQPADTGAGEKANDAAAKPVAEAAAPAATKTDEPAAPEPTEDRPARKPRAKKVADTEGATEPAAKPKRTRKKKEDGE